MLCFASHHTLSLHGYFLRLWPAAHSPAGAHEDSLRFGARENKAAVSQHFQFRVLSLSAVTAQDGDCGATQEVRASLHEAPQAFPQGRALLRPHQWGERSACSGGSPDRVASVWRCARC